MRCVITQVKLGEMAVVLRNYATLKWWSMLRLLLRPRCQIADFPGKMASPRILEGRLRRLFRKKRRGGIKIGPESEPDPRPEHGSRLWVNQLAQMRSDSLSSSLTGPGNVFTPGLKRRRGGRISKLEPVSHRGWTARITRLYPRTIAHRRTSQRTRPKL